MQQAPFFDIVDLKIRVPPHLTQKLSSSHREEELPAELPKREPQGSSAQLLFFEQPLVPVAACLLSLLPLFVMGDGHQETEASCLYLLLSPLTVPILLGFNLHHAGCRWFTCSMAFLSLVLGNVSAVLSCTGERGPARFWLVSSAMATGALQKLLLMHKGNVVLLMFSTASAVLVCCLALAAPLLPSRGMTYRCYQSMSFPMLWLVWQAGAGAKKGPVMASLV
jgi:hypothetical protein